MKCSDLTHARLTKARRLPSENQRASHSVTCNSGIIMAGSTGAFSLLSCVAKSEVRQQSGPNVCVVRAFERLRYWSLVGGVPIALWW